MGPRSAGVTLTTIGRKAVAATLDDHVHALKVKNRPSLKSRGHLCYGDHRLRARYGADRWTKTPSRATA